MLREFLDLKNSLTETLEAVDQDLHHHVSMYAVLGTDDPSWPFDIRILHKAGQESEDEKLINERLFDRGFLDFGFREVRDENNIEGLPYVPLEEQFSNPDAIGCAPWDFFIENPGKARMARGADEDADDDDDLDSQRFVFFLNSVRENILEGQPSTGVGYDDMTSICGLIWKYEGALENGTQKTVIAFQRVQPMWIQQKSSLLFFASDADGCDAFAGRSLKVGNHFDFVIFDSNLYFRSMKALEILFNFNKLVAQQAKDYADSLDPILADFEKIDERIEDSRSVANKLLKLQKEGSAVVDMDPQELQYRVSRIGYYSRKVMFNEEGKVILASNANVNDFIKLLNDSFLVSPLSEEKYEAKSKTRLSSEEI